MSWHLMVIGQLGIALLGCCAAFGWYTRKLRRANAGLFEELEALRATTPAAPAADDAASATTAEETAAAPAQEASAAPDTATVNTESEAGESPAESITDPAAESADSTEPATGMDSGLKVLLQQFTQDSRDMMARIDELESQTRALIAAAEEASVSDSPRPDETEPVDAAESASG